MPPAKKAAVKKAAVKKAAVKKAAVKKAAVKKTNKKRALTLVTSYPTVSDYIAHEIEVWFRTIFIPQQEKNLKKLKKT